MQNVWRVCKSVLFLYIMLLKDAHSLSIIPKKKRRNNNKKMTEYR